MTPLTERYLAAALRGIPEAKRTDVEQELRSSIADAIEDRVNAGEDHADAEKAVLEGLGDPVRLAASMAGRRLYLIGPDLFVVYRQLLVRLLTIVVPIVVAVQVAVGISTGVSFVGALVAGAAGALSVVVHIFFWVTIVFALIERIDAARGAREEIAGAAGRWTIDRLPAQPAERISAADTVGEVLTTLLTIGVMVFLGNAAWFTDANGDAIPFFNPALWSPWLPALIVVLAALAGAHVVVFLVGRWTLPIAVAYTALEAAFAVPVIALALSGSLINPAFADALGWPELAAGNGLVMVIVAVSVGLVTAWEIVDAFRQARRPPG